MEIDNKNLQAERAMGTDLFDWILKNVKSGSTILELGSGTGTIELTKFYKVFSIEHKAHWIGHAKKSNYIFAPIKQYNNYRWYDMDTIKDAMTFDYDFLFIDGPTKKDGRYWFLYHTDLFNLNVPILIDDVDRPDEQRLLQDLSVKLNRKYEIFEHSSNSKHRNETGKFAVLWM